jgi:hypothetical protein
MQQESGDLTCVWVYGKVEPGWYVAKRVWSQAYAEHLQSLGYRVERSKNKPSPAVTAKYSN